MTQNSDKMPDEIFAYRKSKVDGIWFEEDEGREEPTKYIRADLVQQNNPASLSSSDNYEDAQTAVLNEQDEPQDAAERGDVIEALIKLRNLATENARSLGDLEVALNSFHVIRDALQRQSVETVKVGDLIDYLMELNVPCAYALVAARKIAEKYPRGVKIVTEYQEKKGNQNGKN